MTEKTLGLIDNRIFRFLASHCDVMPMRLVKFIAYYYTDARVRKIYLKRLGVTMGENTYSNLGFRIVSNDYEEKLVIGSNVSIAVNAVFVCESTANNGQEINEIPYVRDHLTVNGRIVVNDEVWIGANVTVLQGVTIGKCSVIGAGSVVTKDVPAYSVVAGVPARIIRSLRD